MTQAEIDAARKAAILAHAPLYPKMTCHCCGTKVPKLAIWCSGGCAREYAAEKEALTLRHGL